MNRTGSAFRRNANGLVCNDMRRAGHERKARLGDRAEHRLLVQHLMRVGLRFIRIDGPGQHNHRHTVLVSIGHRVHTVKRTGPDSGNQNGGRAGPVVDTFGHEGRGVLVFCENEPDACGFQRIHERQDFTTRHAKGVPAPRLIQPAGNSVSRANGTLLCHGMRPSGVLAPSMS